MAAAPMTPDEIHERLGFARRRMDELLELNGGDLAGADASERQQLVQEFFFHLVGTIEVLAQLVNERRALGLAVEDAAARRVISALPQGDALRLALEALYANTRPSRPVPGDLYSDEGLVYRIWNYRHQVTHRRRNPFRFNITVGTAPPTPATGHFLLDPRDANSPASTSTAHEEMEQMLDLIGRLCGGALHLIP